MILAGVALPLALLGTLTTPAHGSARAKPGASTHASLLSTSVQSSTYRNPGVWSPLPHGYSLIASLHLRVTPTVAGSVAPRPAPAVRPRSVLAPRVVPAAPPTAPPPAAERTVALRVPAPGPVGAAPVQVKTPVGRSLGVFVITCYDLAGRTASGAGTSLATVAVDPSVIPMGTPIYIQGVGVRVAQDTGGAIRGLRLDLWEPSYAACMAWGVQSRQVSIAG
jgi:3D (Asp-Asp-Asp) domain-containing protein